jgi:penicillin-insensitive murein DD-endopeptidase
MRRRWWLLPGVILAGLLALFALVGNDIARAFESRSPSESIGRAGAGGLRHGKRLPTAGPSFRAYSRLGAALGRTAIHDRVRDAVLEAYAGLTRTAPELRFIYGETGWPSGGPFHPHRSHQNGMSVDFMVPVRRVTNGRVVELPTAPWNKFGYGIEFDSTGRWGELVIDFPAVAAHLEALAGAASRHGLRIERVIFAPEFETRLRALPTTPAVVRRLPFLRGPVWIRHDEHYHVDFAPVAPT